MEAPTTSGALAPQYNDAHWDVLFKMLDAVVPPVIVGDTTNSSSHVLTISEAEFAKLYGELKEDMKNPPSQNAFRDYLATRSSQDAVYVDVVKRMIDQLPVSVSEQFRFMLGAMGSRFGGLLTTGYFMGFDKQPANIREAILQSWHTSWFSLWPMLSRTFVIMGKAAWIRSSSKFPELTGYRDGHSEASQAKAGVAYDFNFMQFAASPEPEVIETDVVIVGSGCGGGVVAKRLAEVGHRVIVVDRGHYFSPEKLPIDLPHTDKVLQGGGGLMTVDGSVTVVAGSSWGGGGSINWSVCLKTTEAVRKEWADAGLSLFTSSEYQAALDRVWEEMGANEKHNEYNFSNKLLLEGAEKLSWETTICGQNTGNSTNHNCGAGCGIGCHEGKKQGPAVMWLPAAAKAGARFIEGFEVSKINFKEGQGQKVAVGIEGTWKSRDSSGSSFSDEGSIRRAVQVKAKRVVVSGGTINSPVLLLNSGLKNSNIGKHLKLHPCGCLTASFEEEVRAWEGPIATVVLTEYSNLDGKGHGPKIYATAMHPLITMLQVPWRNGIQYKVDALKYPHYVGYVAVTRDIAEGTITSDKDGSPIINYTPTPLDRKHILAGLAAACKLCYMRGAIELNPIVPGVSPFKCRTAASSRSLVDADFSKWLQQLEAAAMSPKDSMFQSAHQMSSCRMGKSAETSVVDSNGRVWETTNVYVADASVFPTASGVNPMITTLAIADRIAAGIAAHL